MMYYLILVTIFLLSLLYVNGAKGNLEEITHKVYFDISINGEPAGRITFGLCKSFTYTLYILYLIDQLYYH